MYVSIFMDLKEIKQTERLDLIEKKDFQQQEKNYLHFIRFPSYNKVIDD